ncbi:tetratricopeptide repeat protein [Thalassotalea sp. 1_MG-2023]|uniref:tetratricopeptide repeat protein n=1 Tax=Thalassotalea sp. 1_MG-2023 TaxID=3062680 RepID=UPI0026E4953B|nr:tetratricopeptide repeat protein [Thalassotalea sp. 1_MG-2023]MDO6427435.1 tetratricopeptide repeat protein [Thalassotalea sp. 1_MG-2023]
MRVYPILVQIFILSFLLTSSALAQETETIDKKVNELEQPLYSPFIERYMLDELKSLRQEQQALKAEMIDKVANAKLESSDRALRYTADTTNNIFYIITAAASILVLLGWKSINDIKVHMESSTTKRIEKLTLEYEKRLNALEDTIKERSNQIVTAQKELSDSNLVHSLWMRAGLEKSDQEKMNIYDQILELSPHDVEALTYKADILLDMNDDSWAISLVNQALDIDSEYAFAYWQRACAKAKLEQKNEAIEDIKQAIDLSPPLREELMGEMYFESLKDDEAFIALAEL